MAPNADKPSTDRWHEFRSALKQTLVGHLMQEFSMETVRQVREWLGRSPELNPGPHPAHQHIDVSGWRFEMKEAQMAGQRVRIGFCLELGLIICPVGIDPFHIPAENQQQNS